MTDEMRSWDELHKPGWKEVRRGTTLSVRGRAFRNISLLFKCQGRWMMIMRLADKVPQCGDTSPRSVFVCVGWEHCISKWQNNAMHVTIFSQPSPYGVTLN